MADLARLKIQRGQLKSKLTRLKTFYDSLDLTKVDDLGVSELEIRLEKVIPAIDEFNILQSEIEILSESDSENTERDEFENSYYKLIANAIFDLPIIQKESHIDLRNLFDNVTKHLRSLKALGEPTEHWDTLIIHIITSKLDNTTRREWESFELKQELPLMEDINKFLKQRCELLEKLEVNKSNNNFDKPSTRFKPKNQSNAYVNTNNKVICYYCKRPHTIYKCETFLKHSPADRMTEARKVNLCINCLRPGHTGLECKLSNCKICGRKHNSLLHIDTKAPHDASSSQPRPEDKQDNSENIRHTVAGVAGQAVRHSHIESSYAEQVLLSTAVVRVRDARGNLQKCRALLDSGSQSNFITEGCCKKLNIQLMPANYSITGVGQATSNVNYIGEIELFSNNNAYHATISCLVLPKITEILPMIYFDKSNLKIPDNIRLADPTFNQPGNIDILLGKLNIYSKQQFNSVSYFNTTLKNDVLNDQLVKFWQIEEVVFKPALSKAEQYCENHFLNNFTRNDKGQFVVSIPFKNNVSDLGHSRDLTMQRFLSQERRLMKNPNLYEDYKKFMNEYEQLGFELRKWLTNKRELYDKFYINENLSSKIVQLGENEANKTLGILWNANQDNIQYTIMSISENSIASKRVILSIISQIFDPLGLLGPIIITAKILLQKLWQEKISWDEAIPQNLQTIWSQFLVELTAINNISIPRQAVLSDDDLQVRNISNEHNSEMIPEERIISNVGAVVNKFELFNNFSCLHKLQRVFAYCLRFINNSRTTDKKQGPLSNFELENSLYTLVRLAQQESFSNDYKKLTENKSVDKKSNLLSLNPILDKNKLMRVGGRIQNSNCSFDKRHPIILPAKHKITYLILRQEHRLQQLIQHFWARWHKEYLAELQSRLKWKSEAQNHIKVGIIVLLKEDNAPPCRGT
ncbi:hypothetical protein NQ318_000937 [Aromia moschata]|uniref:DUF5641 domain-containing protein n=1 Tax=Aromia moschata TaxID=1265417 RepID=A0AAV8ZF49_9CUCU|nr:hypothetical protein NQ318_000937 [Aromia moschata]